jgi:glutamine phosphoribosylpyrophosphate amidotransferase
MARDLGLDSVTYLSVEGVDAAYKGPRCAACFDGKYPQPLLQTDRNYIEADRRKAAGRSASETTFSGENLPG